MRCRVGLAALIKHGGQSKPQCRERRFIRCKLKQTHVCRLCWVQHFEKVQREVPNDHSRENGPQRDISVTAR